MKRVMVVGDHNVFRESLALMLEWHTEFKECLQAHSLPEARQVLDDSERNLDLVIVDLDLANASSLELLKELRMSHPDVAVLAITSERDAHRRDEALRAGAAQMLTMAAALRELVEVAKRLVGE